MKRLGGIVLGVALCNATAWAGTVGFGPTDIAVVDPGADMTATFEVFISGVDRPEFNGGFSAIDLLMGSDDLVMSDWSYSGQFTADAAGGFFLGSPTFGSTPFASSLKVGGTITTGVKTPPYAVGTLTVDAAGLDPGLYLVEVVPGTGASELANSTDAGQRDPLTGTAQVRVTPEPATLMLLGLGGVFAIRRRRTAT